jgi:hypothetical protein
VVFLAKCIDTTREAAIVGTSTGATDAPQETKTMNTKTITRAEARAALKTCSPAMVAALRLLAGQVVHGHPDDLATGGIRVDTLRALRDRGFIRFEDHCSWATRNRRSGMLGYHYSFSVSWNVCT